MTEIFPGTKAKTSTCKIVSNSRPPKSSYNSSELGNLFFGEENVRHEIDRDGRENRSNKFSSGCMREHISLESGMFVSKFIHHEIISISPVFGGEDKRVS